MNTEFERLSAKRKELQAIGLLPQWYTTQAYQMFIANYQYEDTFVRGRHETIAKTLSKHLPTVELQEHYEKVFLDLLWKGKLSPASPILANCGTDRGLTVSCSGQFIDDSIDGFYSNLRETAILSKNAFGTSGDFSSVRPRGSAISKGGEANGAREVIDDYFTAARKVSQGGNRRGSFAAYIDIEHDDFYECIEDMQTFSDGKNYGWIIRESFIDKLKAGDPEAEKRFNETLHIKLILGKGYYFFIDKANKHRPQMYKDHGLDIRASNLCTEIMLHSSELLSFSCILSSINLVHWEEIKHDNTIFDSIVFLDCVTSDFLATSKDIPGLEKVRAFTEKGRAVGLGVMGLHTLMQSLSIPMDSLEGMFLNKEIFQRLKSESDRATEWLARVLGEPEWCKGYGVRNTHRTAQAPTKSTALLMGGLSEGINPDPGMVFDAASAVGELKRIIPEFYKIMNERGMYTPETIKRIVANLGSVQQEDWLTDHEKQVFKTAYEMDQKMLFRNAKGRQPELCQGQSLNFYTGEEGCEDLIAELITMCFLDDDILSQYYIYSRNGVVVNDECLSCSA